MRSQLLRLNTAEGAVSITSDVELLSQYNDGRKAAFIEAFFHNFE